MTMGSSWGYKSWDTNWKTTELLIRNLINIVSKGGNYLLNVGPTAEGEIPQQSIDGLKAIGRWMKINGEAIYGTQRSPVDKPAWGYITRKDGNTATTLYLSVCEWPADGKLVVEGLTDANSALLLAENKKLNTTKTAKGLEIQLPGQMPDPIATVIKLELKGKLAPLETNAGQSKGFNIVDE